jgi:hypothetical protein
VNAEGRALQDRSILAANEGASVDCRQTQDCANDMDGHQQDKRHPQVSGVLHRSGPVIPEDIEAEHKCDE